MTLRDIEIWIDFSKCDQRPDECPLCKKGISRKSGTYQLCPDPQRHGVEFVEALNDFANEVVLLRRAERLLFGPEGKEGITFMFNFDAWQKYKKARDRRRTQEHSENPFRAPDLREYFSMERNRSVGPDVVVAE